MAAVLQSKLMQSPLVTWLKTFKENGNHLTYRELSDGSFLREVMMQIRPKQVDDNVVTLGIEVDDTIRSLLSWSLLLKSIRSFYAEELQQMVVMKMPDVVTIAKDPDNESCPEDIRRTLLLLLGCAVQCVRKEYFISQIMALDTDAQHGIMEYIQEITDGSSNVVALDVASDDLDDTSRTLYYHLNKVIAERDHYIDDIAKISIENDLHQESLTEQLQQQRNDINGTAATNPALSADRHHLAVELADSKAKLRRLRIDLEEKAEAVHELRDQVTELKQTVAKLRQENLTLTQDARSARSYRDELDIYKEKARRAEKLETDLARYKERINELDFYKARVDELREDNKILLETKTMLEEQLATSQKRVETIIELENELMKCKHEAEEILLERDQDRYRLRELTEEVTRLEHDKRSTLNESASLEEELMLARSHMSSDLNASLSDQLLDTTKAEMLQLQLENQRLQSLVADMKEQSVLESSSRLIELEKENKRLANKVAKLLESSSHETEQTVLAEQRTAELERQLGELHRTLETVSESHERQRGELEKENEQLIHTVEALRERGEKTHDLRVKDVERENKRMSECVSEMSGRVSRLEYDNRQLQKALERANEHSEKAKQMEDDNEKLTKESVELHKKITALKLACDNYEHLEQELAELQAENKRLQKIADGAKAAAARLERADIDVAAAATENQRLLKTLEALRSSSAARLAEAESERDLTSRQLAEQRQAIERLQQEGAVRLAAAEARSAVLAADNERLQRSSEATASRHTEECAALQAENWRLAASVDALQASLVKLDSMENDGRRLQEESAVVARECAALDKENRRLKQTLEAREAASEELQSHASTLERELRALRKVVDKGKESLSRVKELEAENKDLLQQLAIDKKTVATLREDLVNEKIKTQQLSNDLDRLKSELDKVGLDREKLAALELTLDASRYHALEDMMQDAVKRNAEIHSEKIRTLEKSLDDTRQINATLQKQLDTLMREYEAYLLRRTEEPKVSTLEIPSPRVPQTSVSQLVIKERKPIVAREIIEMKDHTVALERKNAVLTSENDGLRKQCSDCQDRLQKAEAQLSSLSSQVSTVQSERNQLQSKTAQLQVENTTLQSQVTSHANQNATLQHHLTKLEAELDKLVLEHQESVDNYETLVNDHESLQKLNEQLSSEYEALISEHGSLKLQHKSARSELQELQKERDSVAKEKAAIEELQQSLCKERDALAADGRRGDAAAAERDRWRDEAAGLRQQNDRITAEYRRLQQDYRSVKSESNQLKLKHTELQGDMNDCKDQINRMDVELSKLVNRCEALEQYNNKLEDENRQLIVQLQALLQQNQDLLQQTLDRSQHFHEEERSYVEQLNILQKHKEKLENKIMDQYRSIESKPKKKSFDLLRKAKGFIAKRKDKKDLSKSQQDLHQAGVQQLPGSQQSPYAFHPAGRTQHQDAVSLISGGSSSLGEANESGSELTLTKTNKVKLRKMRMRAQSIENLFATPANAKASFLSAHHRKLAVSTASLNVPAAGAKLREVSLTIPLESAHEGWPASSHPKDILSSSNAPDRYSARPVVLRAVAESPHGFPSDSNRDHRGRRSSASSEDSNVPTRDTDNYQQSRLRPGSSASGPLYLVRDCGGGSSSSDDTGRLAGGAIERHVGGAASESTPKLFYTPQPFKKGLSASVGASGMRISASQSRSTNQGLKQPAGGYLLSASATAIEDNTYYAAHREFSPGVDSRTSTPVGPLSPAGLAGDRWSSVRSVGSGGSSRSVTPIRDVYASTQQLTAAQQRLQAGANVYPDAALYGSLQRQPKARVPDMPTASQGMTVAQAQRPTSMPLQNTNGSAAERLSLSKSAGSLNSMQRKGSSGGSGATGNFGVPSGNGASSSDAGDPSQATTNPESPNSQWYEYGCV